MHIRSELRRGITGAEASGTTGRVATRGKSRRSVDEDEVLRGNECACPVTERELFTRYMKILRVLVDLDAEEEKELEAGAENMSEISWGLDFGTLESPDVDVLENFDFDSFLNADGQQLLNPIDGGVPETDDTVSICLGRFSRSKMKRLPPVRKAPSRVYFGNTRTLYANMSLGVRIANHSRNPHSTSFGPAVRSMERRTPSSGAAIRSPSPVQ